MSADSIEIVWSDCIVIFNSLIKNIEALRGAVDSGEVDDDELYEAEEELNDYVTLLVRLRDKYHDLKDKGELPQSLTQKLNTIV